MKKIIIFCVCVLTISLRVEVTGQVDNSFSPIKNHCIWSVNNVKYMTCGDTVISGTSYLKIYRQEENHPFEFDISQAEYFCALRNDLENKRIYLFVSSGQPIYAQSGELSFTTSQDTELLFYDFSISMNDTIIYYQFEDDKRIVEITGTRVPECNILVGRVGYQNIIY